MLLAYQAQHNKDNETDQRLWSALQEGSQQALTDLFVRHHKHLFNYGLKICPNRDVVHESIQNMFMYLWEKHSFLNRAVSVKAYLLASLRRLILEESKKKRARAIRGRKFIDWNSQDAFTVEELLIREEVTLKQRKIVQKAINDLSPRQKEVIFLRFHHGLSNSEITEVMEICNTPQ